MAKTKKKDVALVFGITEDYVFALANTLIGLKKHNKEFWSDIIVFHDGISTKEQKAINEITKVKFVDLSRADYFKRIANSEMDVLEKYSIATFYRYECLKLLDDYRQVIWNDVDILIKDSIEGLLEYGKRTGVAFSMALSNFVMGSSLKKMLSRYKMFEPLWNVGIMVLTDKIEKNREMYEWCIKKTEEYRDYLLWPDLAILNLMLQEFDIEPENIDGEKYVCLPTSEKMKEAKIVHAYGDRKFWNDLDYMNAFPEWIDNAIKWSKLSFEIERNDSPLVSCVMSCYERYDYLLKSINSLLAQTYANFEIIVVLEKSDKQLEIEEFLKDIDDDRIKIIKNKEKLGFAASLNVGIDAAKGKYIARMDDDDIAMLQRFQIQVDFMEKNPNVGVVGGNMQVFGNNHETFAVFSEDRFIKATTLFCVPFMHPTVMMRKKMFDENNLRYDPGYFTEDYELWSRAVYCFECANIPKVLTFYRSHGSQATGNNDLKIHNSHKKVMHNILRKQLKIDLSENEIEVLQMRKGVIDKVMDTDGAFAIRQKAMDRVIEANREQKVFDERALWYIINLGKPNLVDGKAVDGLFEIEEQKAKKRLKHIIKPVISPIYKRLIGKMETIMMNHDEELRISLQRQIDEIKKDRE